MNLEITITPDWDRPGGWKGLHLELDWYIQNSTAARGTAKELEQAADFLRRLACENDGVHD